MANLFGGEGSRSESRRDGKPSRRHQPVDLPQLDLSELSQRIGTAFVEIPGDLASLHDARRFNAVGATRVQAARANGTRCALVVLGVDTWSRHDAPVARGTQVPLEGVARAIRQSIRAYDVAARYGEDEFLLFLDRCDHIEAQRIVHRLSQSVFELQSSAGRLSVSAGIAIFPECGPDMGSLIGRAGSVLRDIRASGRSDIRLVVPDWTQGLSMHPALV